MRGLAWDDAPNDYMKLLSKDFARNEQYPIELDVCESEEEFYKKLEKEHWDFVITDLLKEQEEDEYKLVGFQIAERVRVIKDNVRFPIFIVTNKAGIAVEDSRAFRPGQIIKSKKIEPFWMTYEIRDELKRQGLLVNSKKVFIVYGHDATSNGAKEDIIKFLEEQKFELEIIEPGTLKDNLQKGLIDKMIDCAAVVAISTPDDEVKPVKNTKEHYYQPRGNVLIEIGMSMGFARGLDRLILLQKVGEADYEKTRLPSDLNGILTLTFTNDISETFDDLMKRIGR